MNNVIDRAKGSLLGLAVGDAIGTTVEFSQRGFFTLMDDMIGGGPFNLQPGQWTDDTSMALCLADSLIEHDGFSERDQLVRYSKWYSEGHNSCTGECFDIGMTTHAAIIEFVVHKHLAGIDGEYAAGNGSLMRLAPVAIRYQKSDQLREYAIRSSVTTHANRLCKDACAMFAMMLATALNGEKDKTVILSSAVNEQPELAEIANLRYFNKSSNQIHGTGYVVQSLEAALWCFVKTSSFKEAVLLAANLGDDADTTAAITGQIAGAYYGMSGMPDEWVKRVAWSDEILLKAQKLSELGENA